MNVPPVPKQRYLKQKNKVVKEAKHIYKPSPSVEEYIMKKPPPEPVFRSISKNLKLSNYSEDKFKLIVRGAKER